MLAGGDLVVQSGPDSPTTARLLVEGV